MMTDFFSAFIGMASLADCQENDIDFMSFGILSGPQAEKPAAFLFWQCHSANIVIRANDCL